MNIQARTRTLPLAAIALVAMLFSGCSTVRVEPWERGTFTEYSMRPDRDPLASAMAEHTFFSREATGGGRSVGGSACGCN